MRNSLGIEQISGPIVETSRVPYREIVEQENMTRLDGRPICGMNLCDLALVDYLSDLKEEGFFNEDSRVLLVPAYGVVAFIFPTLGVKSVTAVEIDPTTLAWQKAISDFYYCDEIQKEIPDVLGLRDKSIYRNIPAYNATFSIYDSLRQFLVEGREPNPLTGSTFIRAALGTSPVKGVGNLATTFGPTEKFDFAVVPYLLGLENGLESDQAIMAGLADLAAVLEDGAKVVIAPFADKLFDPKHNPGVTGRLRKIIDQFNAQSPRLRLEFESVGFTGEDRSLVLTARRRA